MCRFQYDDDDVNVWSSFPLNLGVDMRKFLCVILCCCGLLLLSGCGPDNPYGTVAVTGKITVNGEPMEGITVTFVPDSPEGVSAFGRTDAGGNYQLTTGGAPFGTGAIPGTYSVTFSKVQAAEGQSLADFQAGNAAPSPPSGPPQAVHLIPQKYDSPRTAGFEPVEVKQGSRNNFDFNLDADG